MDQPRRKRGRPKVSEFYKKKRIKEMASTRVYLGTQHQRWTTLRKELRLTADKDLAQHLIDSYMNHKGNKAPRRIANNRCTSSPVSEVDGEVDVVNTPPVSEDEDDLHEPSHTPQHTMNFSFTSSPVSEVDVVNTPPVSEVSEDDVHEPSDVNVSMAGDTELPWSDKASLDLPINVTTTNKENGNDENDDTEYEPSFIWSSPTSHNIQTGSGDVTFEEELFGALFGEEVVNEANGDDSGKIVDRRPMENTTQDIHKKDVTEEDINVLCTSCTCIVFLDQLLKLAKINISCCPVCGTRELEVKDFFKGSSVLLEWIGEEDHICTCWCSQPSLRCKVPSRDVVISAATVLSGYINTDMDCLVMRSTTNSERNTIEH